MIILRQKVFTQEPIYYQDGIMIRYNGNKIDDVREVLSNSEIKSLDKAISENTKNIYNDNKDFLKRRGISSSDKFKIEEIDIWGDTKKKPYSISFDGYYEKAPGLFTAEYDIRGKFIRSSYND